MSEFVKRLTAPTKDNAYYFANNIFYQCGYGMPNCFSGDTEFVTRDGIKTMKECLGKSIEVLDLDGNWRKATVEHFGKNELIKLEFGDGSTVLTTPNHRWLVVDKNGNIIDCETNELTVSKECKLLCRKTNKKNISYAHLKSITNTHMIDDVYCVVEPITHTFTLSNMVITRNCTAYAWGRMYELTNQYPRLSTGNAENWYIKNDGYQRGLTPKLGAIACWSKGVVGNGDDGAGHVAAVEEIKPDGTIVTSNSGWKSSYFYIKEIHPPYALSGYNFQGFIYCPIDFDSKPNVQPTPQNFKYNVGDKVIFSGTLYADSQGNGAGQSRSNLVATITLRANGSKPYNLDNGLGWVAESDLQLYKEPVKTALQIGDTVKIIGYGNSQADGRGITAGGIGWTRTVIRILPNTANPYCIGSGNVATGWYPENSLQKL